MESVYNDHPCDQPKVAIIQAGMKILYKNDLIQKWPYTEVTLYSSVSRLELMAVIE